MLDVTDFGTNPHAAEFGDLGVLLRAPRQGDEGLGAQAAQRADGVAVDRGGRSQQWISEVRPLLRPPATRRCGPPNVGRGSGRTCSTPGWPPTGTRWAWTPALDFHSLRRSYVTHLIEDGWDPKFVQQQVGHEHASTTSIYTCVSSDFRTRTLRRALDAMTTRSAAEAITRRRRSR